MRRFFLVLNLCVVVLTAGCVSFPPQFLDEQKLQEARLGSTKLLVAINPQFQICKSRPGAICATPATHKDFPGYEKLGAFVAERLKPYQVNTAVEVYDADLFVASEAMARMHPDYVLRMRQERATSQGPALFALTWLVTLAKPDYSATTASGVVAERIVYRFRYSTMGTYCIGKKLVEAAQGAADTCLGNQADLLVARLKTNGFLD